jgi:hypothetical protein
MKTNELMEIETTVNVTELTNKKLASSIKKIQSALGNIKKNALVISEQLYIVKTQELYKEDYDSLSKFFEETGFSKTRGFRMIKVWEKLIESNGLLESYNASQIEEILPLSQADIEIAIDEEMIKPSMTSTELRKVVKEYQEVIEEVEEEIKEINKSVGTDTEEPKETTIESDTTSIKIGKDGYMVKATQEEILKYLQKKFTFI